MTQDVITNDLDVKFANLEQRAFYYARERNQLFSGGFNNGKSFSLCLKLFTLLTTFDNYRVGIARQVRMDLMKTTFMTFFKICPLSLVKAQNLQEGYTVLLNDSRIDWMHLKDVEESTLRGFEINACGVDQAEEVEEKTYDILDARVGRWDKAVVPDKLIEEYPDWPRNPLTDRHIVPSYLMAACNPDTQFHHLYRHYHPDSPDRKPNHFFVEGEWDPTLGSIEGYQAALRRGPEFVEKYVRGKWGISKAQIHRVYPESLLLPNEELLERIRTKATLYRVLDHGDTAPTCCLWFAAIDNLFICYREYYAPGRLISEHREAINELSGNESYAGNYADPSIFRKAGQKDGGFWTVADEYLTKDIPGKPLAWTPADNNEFATRNRINERLKPAADWFHPITKEGTAPGLYYIKRTADYPNGCVHSISQLGSQRRKLIGYIDGTAIYADDREESIADHAYDCTRYFVSMHGRSHSVPERVTRNSLNYYRKLRRLEKVRGRHKFNA